MRRTINVAVVVLVDMTNHAYAVVQADHLHPNPDFRYKFKGIGGIVSPNESLEDAALRELEEEFPGVWGRPTLTSADYATVAESITDQDGELVDVIWHPFVAPADLSKETYLKARKVATESNLVIFPFDIIPDREQCVLGFEHVIWQCLRRAGENFTK